MRRALPHRLGRLKAATAAMLQDRRSWILLLAGLASMEGYFKVRDLAWPTIDRDLGTTGTLGLTVVAAALVFGILIDLLWPNGFSSRSR